LLSISLFSCAYLFFFIIIYKSALHLNHFWLLGITLLFFIFIGEYHPILKRYIQSETIDKLISQPQESEEIFDQLSDELSTILEQKEIMRVTAERINQHLLMKGYWYAVVDSQQVNLYSHSGTHSTLKDMPPLIQFAKTHPQVYFIDELPIDIIENILSITDLNSGILVPLHSNHNFIGFIIFSEKSSGNWFDQKEITLLNRIRKLLVVLLDRSEPYEKIKENYEKRLLYTEKISRINSYSTLSRGIAHEIRNPMAIMLADTEILPDIIDNKEDTLHFIESLKKNILRVVNITETMLKYGQVTVLEKKSINVEHILDEIILLSTGEFRKRQITPQRNFKGIPMIQGDETRLHQVFLNLIINANQAIDKNGTITISTRESEYKTRYNKLYHGIAVDITDSGQGIPESVIAKMFDPFFSTKYSAADVQHAGLGLSIVLKIIDDHQGMIDVHSEINKGTTFTVFLPIQ